MVPYKTIFWLWHYLAKRVCNKAKQASKVGDWVGGKAEGYFPDAPKKSIRVALIRVKQEDKSISLRWLMLHMFIFHLKRGPTDNDAAK